MQDNLENKMNSLFYNIALSNNNESFATTSTVHDPKTLECVLRVVIGGNNAYNRLWDYEEDMESPNFWQVLGDLLLARDLGLCEENLTDVCRKCFLEGHQQLAVDLAKKYKMSMFILENNVSYYPQVRELINLIK